MDAITGEIDTPDTGATPDVATLLPAGWHPLEVPGVERPAAVGPAGVFVFVVRQRDVRPIGLADPAPWPDRRHRMSAAQMTAELTSQILVAHHGLRVRVRPVVVTATIEALVLDRPDAVHVVHIDQLTWWLSGQPALLDPDTVDAIARTLAPEPSPANATAGATDPAVDSLPDEHWPGRGRLAG